MARLAPFLLLLPCLIALPIPKQPLDPLLGSNGVPRRVPIALLHMYDNVSFFRRLGALTAENKGRYARRHGYDLVLSVPGRTSGVLKPASCDGRTPDAKGKCWTKDDSFDIDHTRAPTFGKIKMAIAACQGRDDGWLLWSDADAMVVNQSIPLEALIDDGYDMMLAYDWLMLNAGMILFKCSDWMKNFLHQVYDARKFDTARALDQSSFQDHLNNLSARERDAHVKVVPKYSMNVYTEEYRPGDFLLHMAGKLYEATEPGLFAIANQFDILSMVDDVEDIKAFFRSTKLLNYYSATCAVNAGQRQHSCKPEDPRRILLNETLGSMSYPNRYRHVGLRYYWLGDWKDKYDVPGWDIKRRALPLPVHPPAGQDMPPLPPAALHDHEVHLDGTAKDSIPKTEESKDSDEEHHHNIHHHEPPEVDHDAEQLAAIKAKKELDDDDDDDDDDDEAADDAVGADEPWPWWGRLLLIGLSSSAIGGLVYAWRKKGRKVSKMQ